MDESKRPTGFVPEPDLQGIQPLIFEADEEKRSNGSKPNRHLRRQKDRRGRRMDGVGSAVGRDGRDRNLEPHELTQSGQRPPYRRGRVRFGS